MAKKKIVRKCLDGLSAKGELTWRLDGHRLMIGGNGRMRDFTDAEQAPWRGLAQQVRMVVVEDGVENIGGRAFVGFEMLREVRLGKDVARIGWRAFDGCGHLGSVAGPRQLRHWRLPAWEGVTQVGYHAFRGTPMQTEPMLIHDGVLLEYAGTDPAVVVPKGVREIAPYAFAHTPLESVELPRTLECVGTGAFYATGLKSVKLSPRLRQVDEFAFAGNPELGMVWLGNADAEFAPNAFDGTPVADMEACLYGQCLLAECAIRDLPMGGEQMQIENGVLLRYTGTDPDVVVPGEVWAIAPGAFADAHLDSVELPKTLKRVGRGAFYATGLKTAKLSAGLRRVDALAFAGNPELRMVWLGSTDAEFAPDAFEGTPVADMDECAFGKWLIVRDGPRFVEVENGKWSVWNLRKLMRAGAVLLLLRPYEDGSFNIASYCYRSGNQYVMEYEPCHCLADKGICGDHVVEPRDLAEFRQRYAGKDTWISIASESTDYYAEEELLDQLRYLKACVRMRGAKLFFSWDRGNFWGPLEADLCKKWLDEHPDAYTGFLEKCG